MDDRSTLGESTAPTTETVGALTVVLQYEDLLADAGATFRLGEGATFTIGRASEGGTQPSGSDDQLLLADRWVSTRHAVLQRKAGGALFIEDGGSRNGTFVNGSSVDGRQRIFDGDLLEIGHTLLCYRDVPAPLLDAVLESGPARLGPTSTRCPELVALVRDLSRVAPSRQAVLVLGETGVGKEIVARAVHDASGRRGELCPVDCGAIPENLFEGTFFGHRRGAFTGAAEPRTGEIVRADGGTLFLDEVANMSLACQAKLLRVLEEGKVTPLGASDAQQVDVRWIAATNADPFARGPAFRPDLVQRLASFVVRMPPLRRRREDLGALAAHFLRELGLERASITAAAGRRLFSDPFAGNVRKLRAMLQTAALLAGDKPIDVAHLPPADSPADDDARDDDEAPAQRARTQSSPPTAAPDTATMEAALAKTGGNVIRAAELLDVRPRQLYRWISKFALPLDKYRSTRS